MTEWCRQYQQRLSSGIIEEFQSIKILLECHFTLVINQIEYTMYVHVLYSVHSVCVHAAQTARALAYVDTLKHEHA